jgi:AcrR family transcriptional regulator
MRREDPGTLNLVQLSGTRQKISVAKRLAQAYLQQLINQLINKPMSTRPGRPALDKAQDASARIVRSACLQFARHGIKGSSNRLIAEEAQVTAALVHYYFRRREDLHLAVLQAAFAPLLEKLPQIASLADWVAQFHAHLLARPWLPHLMIREVLSQSGGLRVLFLQHFAPPLFGALRAHVGAELRGRNNKVRPGFDIDRHAVLLMGMLVYPFLGLEIAQDVTGRKFDRKMLEGFRDDALRLFLSGTGARQETR